MNFNQFRRSQFDSFLTPLTYKLENLRVQSNSSTAVVFEDKVINLQGDNILLPTESDGIRVKNYFMRVRIYKKSQRQIFIIKLVNTNKNEDNTQIIKKITIEAGNEKEYASLEVIIPPNNSYNQIKFELQREIEDYNTKNNDGTYGRKATIEINRLDEIYNLINYLDSFIDNKGRLLQIGVQSNPGLMMCINSEEIRVGRSGIYEINNGYKITFIGFIVEPNDNKHFILDYKY